MDDNIVHIKLKIDKEFKTLIRPLSPKEYEQLEANILADGCRDPIVTWHGYIIDGHNRYEICRKHNIGFKVKEMSFETVLRKYYFRKVNRFKMKRIAKKSDKQFQNLENWLYNKK